MSDQRRVRQVDALTLELRQWLLRQAGFYGTDVVATTLVYELAAIIGRSAETVEQADELIDAWSATMRDQVRAFGVGVEYP